MPSPFPGMDPYLERPEVFPDFHDSFITYLRENLQANLPPPYYAAIGRRVWIEVARRSIGPDVNVIHRGPEAPARAGPPGGLAVATEPVAVRVPHDEFREPLIEIYAKEGGDKRLVASLEVLSLSNKTPGAHGRDLYLRKQRELLAGQVHLVEIDLLRGGEHATAVPLDIARDACGAFDYHVSVHRFDDLETFFVYPIRLEGRLPTIAVPLLPGDPPVPLALQAVFDRCYDAGPYAREIGYGTDPLIPPLRPAQEDWAGRVLREG
jgi:hypothetical protein